MDILHAIPPGDLGVLALGLIIAGAVGGLLAGVLGIGGGIVVVPVLYHVLATLGLDESVRMHVAVGTALAAAIPVALSRAQNELRTVDRAVLRSWAAPVLVGVLIGSALMAVASGRVLALIFAIVAAPVVLYLTASGKERVPAFRMPRILDRIVLPVLVGGATAMTGMGGTTIAAPALALGGISAAQRAATASVLGVLMAIPAALGAVVAGWRAQPLPPDSLGYVNLLAFALVAPILLLAEPAGAALAHMIDMKRLRLVFAALIAITTARMLWDALA
ncbi:MAG: sulfite exporter TauE/SafE family protein [Rhizomicrobium sp.]